MEKNIYKYYDQMLKTSEIDDHSVYFESHDGTDLGGNLFYIAKELLSGSYGSIKAYIMLKKESVIPHNVKLLLSQCNKDNIKLVIKESIDQIFAMTTSRYLFTDVQFSNFYRKREGQICIQTWHGTPLKCLGYEFIDDVAYTGAQKKSFIDSDIILYPNEYTMKHMNESYRLNNLCHGNFVIGGYPRNAIFFDEQIRIKVRDSEKITNKFVYAYMPTWRGNIEDIDGIEVQIYLLDELDRQLDDNHILYVKFHRLMSNKINFDNYTRIKAFPAEWETYEFLTSVDCLITDYSSVMFDFLCTKRKTILYTYDKKEYLKKQGTYIEIDNLPFPQVDSIETLIEEMKFPKQYDDTEVYQYFCPYDNALATKELCEQVINYNRKKYESNKDSNQKNNILLYGGALDANIHTTNFVDFIDTIDTQKYNACVCYKNIEFIKNPIRLQVISKPTDLISIDYYKNDLYYDSENCKNDYYDEDNSTSKKVDLWHQAFCIQFHNLKFKKIICYIEKYDDVLELLAASSFDTTFVIDKDGMTDSDYYKVLKLGRYRKVSIVKTFDAVRL